MAGILFVVLFFEICNMGMNAIVPFDGGEAHYIVSPASNGIYQAQLIDFKGASNIQPPPEVILVKGYRQWSGSYDRQDLLNQLGEAIENERNRSGNPNS